LPDDLVEAGVLFRVGLASGDLVRLLLQDRAQLGELVRADALRRRCRDRGLDEPADLDDVGEGVTADDEVRQRPGEILGDRATDERAAAGARLDDTEELERSERLADRRARDLELLCERPFGRQLIARVQLAAVEESLDLADDVLVQPAPADGFDDRQQ
jgi:hypothetical protein